MGSSLITLGLGSGKIQQTSISESVDQKFIENIFIEKLDEIEIFVKKINDDFANELFFDLKNKKK